MAAWLVFFLNKTVSFNVSHFVLAHNIEPVFLMITDLDRG